MRTRSAGFAYVHAYPLRRVEIEVRAGMGYASPAARDRQGIAYDVSPDGKRFLVVTPPRDQSEPPDLVVIQHWDEELKARVPVK